MDTVGASIGERSDGKLKWRARDVDVLVSDGNDVHARFLGREMYSVQTFVGVADFGVLHFARWRGDFGGHVKSTGAGDFEG